MMEQTQNISLFMIEPVNRSGLKTQIEFNDTTLRYNTPVNTCDSGDHGVKDIITQPEMRNQDKDCFIQTIRLKNEAVEN